MDLTKLKKAVRIWIENETGLTVVESDQAESRPSKPPYVCYQVGAEQKKGHEENRQIDTNGISLVVGRRQRTFTIDINGAGANALAESLRLGLAKNEVTNFFYGYDESITPKEMRNIAIVDSSNIIDATALMETLYIERAVFDVTFAYSIEVQEDVGIIEQVEITGNGETQTIDIEDET